MAQRHGMSEEKHNRLWYAHGGPSGVKPILPPNPNDWKPGMPVHWIEQTPFLKRKALFIRLVSFLQLALAVVYLQYRARNTIGVFEESKTTILLIYQIFFFVLECISALAIMFRLFEHWNITFRNCINFYRIPNDLIIPNNDNNNNNNNIPPQFCNYPSIDIFIPCYNEDVDLITETVVAALQIDYPFQLLTVYLCDDGKDLAKRQVISQLRHQHKNVHYVIRPEHSHAKAGNLNYAIQRTKSDLIITLDADFVARPNLIQRLLPYYYVWNPTIGMYEFNNTLAYVQTPQYFRNLSPYDSDAFDQRATIFFDQVLPGKDWFNASTLVGTTNLINRQALKKANYYPYHSITEDSALSIIFHSLKFRSYYVRESLASGLATTSLWANLRQRARWLKGDWQILFSKYGPISIKGLNTIQRILYLHMQFSRVISIIHLFYDIIVILLLTLQLSPLDADRPIEFFIYLAVYLIFGIFTRFVVTFGGGGLDKSESSNVAFEAIFRYTTIKGLFIALFRGDKLKFKVTDKPTGHKSAAATAAGVGIDLHAYDDLNNGDIGSSSGSLQIGRSTNSSHRHVSISPIIEERFIQNARSTVLGQSGPGMAAHGVENVNLVNGQVLGAQDEQVGAGSYNDEYNVPSVMDDMKQGNMNGNNNHTRNNNNNDRRIIDPKNDYQNVGAVFNSSSTNGDDTSSVRFSIGVGDTREEYQAGAVIGREISTEDAANRITMPPIALINNRTGATTGITNTNTNTNSNTNTNTTNTTSSSMHARDRRETLRSGSSSEYSELTGTEDDQGRSYKKKLWSETEEERIHRRIDIRKNLKRSWFNIFMIIILTYAIVWGIIFPPKDKTENVGDEQLVYKNVLPTGLALGFALCNLLPHLLALYLCFIPYLSGWMMTDLQNGRCDQWAIHPKSGKLFVPFSFISLLSLARLIIIIGALTLTILASLSSEVERIPLPPS